MLPSSNKKGIRSFLNVNPETQFEIVRGLASPVRVRILRLLRRRGPLNVNQISEALGMLQSTIATNIQILEESDLIDTETGRARKGQQKICAARFDEIVIRLDSEVTSRERDIIEVEMPLGLYTSYHVSAPCGLCSTEGIMGVLDVPDLFLVGCRPR
jgi:predicted transcriptional regulator